MFHRHLVYLMILNKNRSFSADYLQVFELPQVSYLLLFLQSSKSASSTLLTISLDQLIHTELMRQEEK